MYYMAFPRVVVVVVVAMLVKLVGKASLAGPSPPGRSRAHARRRDRPGGEGLAARLGKGMSPHLAVKQLD